MQPLKTMKTAPSFKVRDSFIVDSKNSQSKWNLDQECQKVAIRVADEFGMSVEQFLDLYSRHRLPAQLVRGDRLSQEKAPAGFSVALCKDPLAQMRIRRAARFADLSVEDFVWRTLASAVNCCEDDMILSPKTGRPVAGDFDLESFMMRRELDE